MVVVMVAGGNPSPYLLNLRRRKFLVLHPPQLPNNRGHSTSSTPSWAWRGGGAGGVGLTLSACLRMKTDCPTCCWWEELHAGYSSAKPRGWHMYDSNKNNFHPQGLLHFQSVLSSFICASPDNIHGRWALSFPSDRQGNEAGNRISRVAPRNQTELCSHPGSAV